MDLKLSDFEISFCQASIFTPDLTSSVRKLLTEFYSSVADTFDDEPSIFVPGPPNMPNEVPRIVFRNISKAWRFEIAPARVNLIWEKSDPEIHILKDDFFNRAVELFGIFSNLFAPKIGRVAALLHRFAKHPTPGLYLARHFCKPEHIQGALNRAENFELNAHKRYTLDDKYHVNSWARNKSGSTKSEPVIIFEQDLNTLSEEIESQKFDMNDLKNFFGSVLVEFDKILNLYYPVV
ncbi:MAG: hypothetical protein ABSB32_18040 [Thermodesulfobacteriota bacterium]